MKQLWKKILVPLDDSPLAKRALDVALSTARSEQAELVLLRVHTGKAPLEDPDDTESAIDSMEAETDALVKAARARAEDLDIPPEHIHAEVRRGPIVGCIIAAAEELMVDLIVMATHGRKTFGELFTGTVTERVVSKSTASVTVVRPLGYPYLQDT